MNTAAPTVVGVKPIYLDNASLVIEGLDYAAAASKIECVPTTSSATYTGLKRDAQFNSVSVTGWTLNIDFVQDFETAESFSNLCHDHQGESVTIRFEPVTGGQAWEIDAQLVPGAIGGAGAAYATTSISLGAQGAPRKVAAVVAPPLGGE